MRLWGRLPEPAALRRGAIAACLAAVVAALAACGGGDATTTSASTAETEAPAAETTAVETAPAESGAATETEAAGPVEGTLTFWVAPTGSSVGPWWEAFVEDFEAKYPDAKVELSTFTTEEYQTKYLAAFAAGDEPDVFEIDTGEILGKYIRAGKIAQLNDLVDFDYYNPASLAPLTYPDGGVYGIPDYWYIMTMWYNTDLLSTHNIEPPTSWSELLAACEALSADGVIPIAFGNGGSDTWTAGHWYDSILYQYGGTTLGVEATFGENGASWTDPSFVETATRLHELVAANCFPPGFTGINYAQMSSLFLQGKAAMIFTGTWFSGQIAGAEVNFGVDVFPLPDGPGATYSTADLQGIPGGVSALSASKKAVDDNAALVVAFLNEFGAVADDYANANDQLSVAVEPQPSGDPLQGALAEMLTSVGELATMNGLLVPAALVDDVLENLQGLTAGDLSPEEFVKTMAEDVERERPNFPADG